MKRKILILSLDGATWNVLEPFIQEGILPYLSDFRDSGVYGPFKTTTPPLTAPAWASFMTGKNPGKTGVYDFLQFNRLSKTYIPSPVNSSYIRGMNIFEILSRKGYKIGAFNIPLTYPPFEVNGFLVSGMLTPSEKSNFVFPSKLREDRLKYFKNYRIHLDWRNYEKIGVEELLKNIREVEKTRFLFLDHCMNEFDWDFLVIHIPSTDWIQHSLWRFIDPSHPHYEREEAEKVAPKIKDIFHFLDRKIEKIAKSLDESTVTFITSDHGFGPVHKKVNFNALLVQKGLASAKHEKNSKAVSLVTGMKKKVGTKRIRALIKRFGMSGKVGRLVERYSDFAGTFDWKKTLVYNSVMNGFQINLSGREPEGIIRSKEQYEELRTNIIQLLKNLKDPLTQKSVVYDVKRREDVYTGPFLDIAPDVMITDYDESYLTRQTFDLKSPIFEETGWTSGHHQKLGVIMVKGDIIRKGKLDNAQIIDIFPTVLYILDEDIPDDIDGIPLMNMFTEGFKERNKPRFSKGNEKRQGIPEVLSGKEEDDIIRHLKGLGYYD